MTIDNLNCLLKKFTFLPDSHPADRSISITVANEYIDISIVINRPGRSPRRSLSSLAIQYNEESISNDYDIYPIIKDILSYLGLTHKNFYRLLIREMNENIVKFTIYTSDFWNVGKKVYDEFGNSQRIADLMEEDLPIPLSEEKINKAKEASWKQIKSSYRYFSASHDISQDIINQVFDSITPVEATSAGTINAQFSSSSNTASLNF